MATGYNVALSIVQYAAPTFASKDEKLYRKLPRFQYLLKQCITYTSIHKSFLTMSKAGTVVPPAKK